ncbi:Alpha-mannosidase [Flavobacterium sp. 9AF]|uniref:alpha/beta hydrolase n=1 Tax=Flavobacterium sp. 9AF TaxID=2653142 RepID=UPI0012F2A479|nr:alpha/beta hydrolase-fold protein [Flavobacterium sp. 9AF]VXB70013.1 Alpha-mannosidase [Flavobacterium sp. 9AF]
MKKLSFLFIIFFLTSVSLWAQKRYSPFEIKAPQLDTIKRIWVYLPLDYNESEKKYPVLYMHDAQNLFDEKTAFSGEWKIDETLDSLQAKIIVVGIEHGNEKRIEELTPYKNEKYGGGNADNYLDFIVSTLKPHIDSIYRTKTNSRNTGIMGSSLGGLVSFYASLKYPDIFGKVGVFSPSFWFTNDIYTLTEQTKKIDTKYYFMCGDNESESMVDDMNQMIHLIRQKRCDCLHLHKTKIVAHGKHNEKLWSKEFAKAYLWLF